MSIREKLVDAIQEREQKRFVSSNPWPSKQVVKYHLGKTPLHVRVSSFGEWWLIYYNHSLAEELYNAGGVADPTKRRVALRRVGWKIKAHGESFAGKGNCDGIMTCMWTHFYTLDEITRLGGIMPSPPCQLTFRLECIWDGIGPWSAEQDEQTAAAAFQELLGNTSL